VSNIYILYSAYLSNHIRLFQNKHILKKSIENKQGGSRFIKKIQ